MWIIKCSRNESTVFSLYKIYSNNIDALVVTCHDVKMTVTVRFLTLMTHSTFNYKRTAAFIVDVCSVCLLAISAHVCYCNVRLICGPLPVV